MESGVRNPKTGFKPIYEYAMIDSVERSRKIKKYQSSDLLAVHGKVQIIMNTE